MAGGWTMNALANSKHPPASSRRWKILLINANRCTTPEPVFPLGLAHLSAALGKSGHGAATTLLIDFDLKRLDMEGPPI